VEEGKESSGYEPTGGSMEEGWFAEDAAEGKKCPHCGAMNLARATACKRCGRSI